MYEDKNPSYGIVNRTFCVPALSSCSRVMTLWSQCMILLFQIVNFFDFHGLANRWQTGNDRANILLILKSSDALSIEMMINTFFVC